MHVCLPTYIHLTLKCVHFGMLLCSSLEINTEPSAIVSIQVTEVKGLPDTLNISPIHLQFEVAIQYIIISLYQILHACIEQ